MTTQTTPLLTDQGWDRDACGRLHYEAEALASRRNGGGRHFPAWLDARAVQREIHRDAGVAMAEAVRRALAVRIATELNGGRA